MRSRPALTLSVVLVCCLGTPASGERQVAPKATARELLGIWDLVSYEDHRPNGEVLSWWGPHPSGVLTYSPSGRMTVQFMRDPRPTFAAGRVWGPDNQRLLSAASAAEVQEAFTGYYAYFGTYEVDERAQAVTHHIKASLRSHEVGVDYVRPFELSGDQLKLRYPVTADDGEIRTRIIIWHRAERF
jgi:hypothetical protein